MTKKIRPLTLEVEEDLWNRWKVTVPRTITLSKAIQDLIEDDLEFKKKGKKVNRMEITEERICPYCNARYIATVNKETKMFNTECPRCHKKEVDRK